MQFLETERLVLRNLKPEDAAIMHDYRNNELCARYQRDQTRDLPGIENLIRRHAADTLAPDRPAMLAVALKSTGTLIGEIVVMPVDGTISLGYTFSYRIHRQGYAYEALSALMQLLEAAFPSSDYLCWTDPDNAASMALLRKLGYTHYGRLTARDAEVFGYKLRKDTLHNLMETMAAPSD